MLSQSRVQEQNYYHSGISSNGQRMSQMTASAVQQSSLDEYDPWPCLSNQASFTGIDSTLVPTLPLSHYGQPCHVRHPHALSLQPMYGSFQTMHGVDAPYSNPVTSHSSSESGSNIDSSFSTHASHQHEKTGVAPTDISPEHDGTMFDQDMFATGDDDPLRDPKAASEEFFSQQPIRRSMVYRTQRRPSSAKTSTSNPLSRRPSTKSRRSWPEVARCRSYESRHSQIQVSINVPEAEKKPFPCPVEGCINKTKYPFKRGEHLKRHMKTVHTVGDNPFLCALAFGGDSSTCTINHRTTSRKEPGEGKTPKKLGIARRDNQYQHYQTHLRKKAHTTRNRLVSPDFLFFLILKYEDFSEEGSNVIHQVRKACAKSDFEVDVPDIEYMKTHLDYPEYLQWLARQERLGGIDRYFDELDGELDVGHVADRYSTLILSDVKCEAEEIEDSGLSFCN